MAIETLKTSESALEQELNAALKEFSAQEALLKSEIMTKNKDIKPQTKEEMERYLKSGKLKERLEKYVQINGEKITISKLTIETVDDISTFKLEYTVKLEGQDFPMTSYFQVMKEQNNTYLQFKKDPNKEKDVTSKELYNDNGTKKFVDETENYNGGKMYDINIVKTANKGIDIRIEENERKTKEKILEKIKKYELKGDFKPEDFVDESLENTKIETLQYTQLGKEIKEVSGDQYKGYYRSIFIREGEKYKEIGKVYFDEKGTLDVKKTIKEKKDPEILGMTLKLTINTDNNTFKFDNIDELKKKIKEHREILKTYIQNSEFGDNTIFVGFNKNNGIDWTQTKLLGLKLVDDMYTFKRRGIKQTETINFGFEKNNNLKFKDIGGKEKEIITIEIEKANGAKETRNITKDDTKKQLLIEPSKEKMVTNQEKPELENQPNLLVKEYLYSQNEDGSNIEYHTKKGELISSFPASKNEKNEWKLGKLSETVNPEDLYKDLKKELFVKGMKEKLQNINILDKDIYAAFTTGLKKDKVKLEGREVVKVLDDEKNAINKYYKVKQKKDGEPMVFEEDEKLYESARKVMNDIMEKINILEKIENTQLKYMDKKEKVEKKFTQFVGGSGLLPIKTQEKIDFLQKGDEKTTLTKQFSRGMEGEEKTFDITYDVKDKKITSPQKEQTINNQKYKVRLEDTEEGLKLRFDDIEK